MKPERHNLWSKIKEHPVIAGLSVMLLVVLGLTVCASLQPSDSQQEIAQKFMAEQTDTPARKTVTGVHIRYGTRMAGTPTLSQRIDY